MATDYHMMTVEKALALARDLKYGPLPTADYPMPSVEDAIDIIYESRLNCGHTWLTADEALKVLHQHQKQGKS